MIQEPDPAALGAVHGFLVQVLADRARGEERTLEEYQRHFAGFETAVASAWAELGAREVPRTGEEVPTESFGRFRLERLIGRGGQGLVYLAHDPRLNRRVALKLLAVPLGDSEEARRRFRREAESAGRIAHPGICAIYEVGEHQGQPYIVMQYVEGQSLARVLALERDAAAHREAQDAARDRVARAVRMAEQLARAVHAAHEAGVVHRDLKPSNVMVTPAGEPVVLDFGLARDDADETASLTRIGDAFGTPAYMAPEQIQPDRCRPDRLCDVYALGIVLYECLTLHRPFEAPTRTALARKILEESPPSARRLCPAVSRDLEIVLETALAKDPAERYQTALHLAEDLARLRAQRPILARPVGRAVRVWRWTQRNRALSVSLSGLFAALVLGLGITAYHLRETRRSLDRIENLSDSRIVPYLERQDDVELWPAVPERVPAMDAWLDLAEAAHSRLPEYRSQLADLQRRGSLETAMESTQLSALVNGLTGLGERIVSVRRRGELAATLERRSIEEHREPWERTIAGVSASPHYGGLAITPQLGLVPLGQDQRSRLFEFALLDTGVVPQRGAKGFLAIGADTAIVLVLLPGGRFRMGQEDAARFGLKGDDLSPVEVLLDPFLISKYEMTQAQWQRAAGRNPSFYVPGQSHSGHPTGVSLANPVESVSWEDCVETLRRLSLELPTEARWEYACRAGTTTLWHTGNEVASLAGFANFADAGSSDKYSDGWAFEPELNDAYLAHAPVGRFQANDFGLHDMHGNVNEWCLDGWSTGDSPPRSGDGLRLFGNESIRIYRGGNYFFPAGFGTSAGRAGEKPWMRTSRTGVRPARSLR